MNTERVEKILDNRLSTVGGSLLVMPLLLLLILFGTISFSGVSQQDNVIEKILTPPLRPQQMQAEFSDVFASQSFESALPEFEADLARHQNDLTPEMIDQVVEIRPTSTLPGMQVDLDEAPQTVGRQQEEQPSVEVGNQGLYDRSADVVAQQTNNEELAVVNRGTTPGGSQREGTIEPTGGQVVLPGDGSERVTAEMLASGNGLQDAVMVRRGGSSTTSGLGIERPVSEEKGSLTGWILRNQAPLRPAIQNALGYSALKEDLTSTGHVLDEEGNLYKLFFLYRTENNLLRILVVTDRTAYRIDLPDFYLEANHVQKGEVSFDGGDGGIIEVSLAAVPTIPGEVPGIFEIVLQWLEIKKRD